MDYGVFEEPDTLNTNARNNLEYRTGNGATTFYQLPKWNYSFGSKLLETWPPLPRPVIKKMGTRIAAEGEGNQWTWYKLEGPSGNTRIKLAGKGQSITPENGAVYCVVGPYGSGYSESAIYDTKKDSQK